MSIVLVVDDDEPIRTMVAEVLRSEGHSVRTASDGMIALARIRDRLPDVILLDLNMPVLNGWEFAREVHRKGFRVPIIVMTAEHEAAGRAEVIGAGAVLPKPFQIDDLLRLVRAQCSQGLARPVTPGPHVARARLESPRPVRLRPP